MFKKLTNFSRLFIFSVFVIGVFGTKLRRALLPRTPQSIVGFDPRILMSSSFVVFTVLHVLPLRPRAVAPRSCGRLLPPAFVLIPPLRPQAVALDLVEVAPAGLLGLDSSSSAPGSGSRACRGCPRRPLGFDSSSWAPGSGSQSCRGCPRRPLGS